MGSNTFKTILINTHQTLENQKLREMHVSMLNHKIAQI